MLTALWGSNVQYIQNCWRLTSLQFVGQKNVKIGLYFKTKANSSPDNFVLSQGCTLLFGENLIIQCSFEPVMTATNCSYKTFATDDTKWWWLKSVQNCNSLSNIEKRKKKKQNKEVISQSSWPQTQRSRAKQDTIIFRSIIELPLEMMKHLKDMTKMLKMFTEATSWAVINQAFIQRNNKLKFYYWYLSQCPEAADFRNPASISVLRLRANEAES